MNGGYDQYASGDYGWGGYGSDNGAYNMDSHNPYGTAEDANYYGFGYGATDDTNVYSSAPQYSISGDNVHSNEYQPDAQDATKVEENVVQERAPETLCSDHVAEQVAAPTEEHAVEPIPDAGGEYWSDAPVDQPVSHDVPQVCDDGNAPEVEAVAETTAEMAIDVAPQEQETQQQDLLDDMFGFDVFTGAAAPTDPLPPAKQTEGADVDAAFFGFDFGTELVPAAESAEPSAIAEASIQEAAPEELAMVFSADLITTTPDSIPKVVTPCVYAQTDLTTPDITESGFVAFQTEDNSSAILSHAHNARRMLIIDQIIRLRALVNAERIFKETKRTHLIPVESVGEISTVALPEDLQTNSWQAAQQYSQESEYAQKSFSNTEEYGCDDMVQHIPLGHDAERSVREAEAIMADALTNATEVKNLESMSDVQTTLDDSVTLEVIPQKPYSESASDSFERIPISEWIDDVKDDMPVEACAESTSLTRLQTDTEIYEHDVDSVSRVCMPELSHESLYKETSHKHVTVGEEEEPASIEFELLRITTPDNLSEEHRTFSFTSSLQSEKIDLVVSALSETHAHEKELNFSLARIETPDRDLDTYDDAPDSTMQRLANPVVSEVSVVTIVEEKVTTEQKHAAKHKEDHKVDHKAEQKQKKAAAKHPKKERSESPKKTHTIESKKIEKVSKHTKTKEEQKVEAKKEVKKEREPKKEVKKENTEYVPPERKEPEKKPVTEQPSKAKKEHSDQHHKKAKDTKQKRAEPNQELSTSTTTTTTATTDSSQIDKIATVKRLRNEQRVQEKLRRHGKQINESEERAKREKEDELQRLLAEEKLRMNKELERAARRADREYQKLESERKKLAISLQIASQIAPSSAENFSKYGKGYASDKELLREMRLRERRDKELLALQSSIDAVGKQESDSADYGILYKTLHTSKSYHRSSYSPDRHRSKYKEQNVSMFASKAACEYYVKVLNYRTVLIPNSRPFISYYVEFGVNGRKMHINCRFSEVKEMHKAIASAYPLATLPPLPPDRPYAFGGWKPEFIEERKKLLETYLYNMHSITVVRTSNIYRQFLRSVRC